MLSVYLWVGKIFFKMFEGSDTLCGKWTGRYDYGGMEAPVPFDVVMEDVAGALSGEITEPNTFRADIGGHLTAVLIGVRSGSDVSFRKSYDGFDQGDDPFYEGRLNGALTRIDGLWRFPKDAGMSGRFMMVRAVDVRARKAAAVEAVF